MDIKINESTPQRPGGDRILNAPLVKIDLEEYKSRIKSEPSWKDSDRNAITVFKSDTFRLVLIALHKDALMATHTAEGMISVQVLEGEIHFSVPDNTVALKEGHMLTLHDRIPHSVLATKESVFLLTLSLQRTAV